MKSSRQKRQLFTLLNLYVHSVIESNAFHKNDDLLDTRSKSEIDTHIFERLSMRYV